MDCRVEPGNDELWSAARPGRLPVVSQAHTCGKGTASGAARAQRPARQGQHLQLPPACGEATTGRPRAANRHASSGAGAGRRGKSGVSSCAVSG